MGLKHAEERPPHYRCLAAGGGWLLYYFSDQQVIKRKFATIAVLLSKDVGRTPL